MSSQQTKPTIQNYLKVKVQGTKSEKAVPVPIEKLVQTIEDNLDRAPLVNLHGQLVGTRPFKGVPTDAHILRINRETDLRAWLRYNYDLIWSDAEVYSPRDLSLKTKPVTAGELQAALRQRMRKMDSVEILPHFPPRPAVYYLRGEHAYRDGDGSHFWELISRLNPETDQDRDLLAAMFMTPMWGGEGGERPLFMVTSQHGRGTGKSTTVELLSALYGGHTLIDADRGDVHKVLSRALGTESEISKRIVLIDNLKKTMNSATFDTMVTSRFLNADQLYRGTFQPPNLKTYVVTLNAAQSSTDIAQRAVCIEIGPPPHGSASPTFKSDLLKYIEQNREAILSDVLGILRGQAKSVIARDEQTRWGPWESAILSRFENGPELLRLIKVRRVAMDTEAQEAEEVIATLRTVLSVEGINPDSLNVCIPADVLLPALQGLWGLDKLSAQGMWKKLKPMETSDSFRGVGACRGRSTDRTARGLEWKPNPKGRIMNWVEARESAPSHDHGTSNVIPIGMPTKAPSTTTTSTTTSTKTKTPEPEPEGVKVAVAVNGQGHGHEVRTCTFVGCGDKADWNQREGKWICQNPLCPSLL